MSGKNISMKVHELAPHLKRDGLGPLYLVMGEEAYFRDQALSILRHAAASLTNTEADKTASSGKTGGMFEADLVYGDETDSSEILTFAEEVSFFSTHKLLIVKWADKLAARMGEALIPYFQDPNTSTTLVLVAPKLDGRTKWVQDLKKRAIMVDCAPLFENQRAIWVTQRAKVMGLNVEPSALEALKDQASEGLYATAGEMEKLMTFLPEGQKASAHDVERVRGKPPGISVFDWSEAVGKGDHVRALHIVAKNLEIGEAPLRMLGAFLWQMRRIWKVRDLIDEGKDPAQAVRKAGIPPFRAREFLQQVHYWKSEELRKAWPVFAHADSALKGGRAAAPKLILDDLVIRLCQGKQREEGSRRASRTKGVSSRKPVQK